jgi:trimeric autotransporter adhesin
MRKIFLMFVLIGLSIVQLFGQVPEKFNYQGILRNTSGEMIKNTSVTVRISLLQGSTTGIVQYSENHTVTTNNYGQFSVNIGGGTVLTGVFATINWLQPMFLKTEVANPAGGTFVDMGTTQLLSVPYALYAKNVENKDDADADPINELQALSISNDTIFLSNGGFVKLPADQVDDADHDPMNEIQDLNLSSNILTITNKTSPTQINLASYTGTNTDEQHLNLSGTVLSITGGNNVDLAPIQDGVDDADNNPTNELQNLTLTGDTLKISNGNRVVFPYDSSRWAINGDKLYYNTGNIGIGTSDPTSKLEVKSSGTGALFQVINANNDTVFAVYPDGVKVFVDSDAKGKVGGFAISGRTPTKAGVPVEYFRVTTDSTRIYVNDSIDSKGKVGGFAISGRTPTKGGIKDYFSINKDSTRIYVNDSLITKGRVGGFAISGRTPTKAGETSKFMDITKNNYFIGHQAGNSNTLGKYNSFIGYESGYKNSTGYKNYLIGYRSGYNNLSGFSNIFIGDSAGFTNNSGSRNVFIGNQSGTSNTIGENNTAIGLSSMLYNTKGNNNTALGWYSMAFNSEAEDNTAVGRQSLYSNMLGSDNTAIGTGALWQMPLSISNTALGYNAYTTSNIYWNSTALGANAQINASNKVRIGDVNVAVVEATSFFATSDGRFKNLVKAEVIGLDFITRLNPVIYTFDTQRFDEFLMKGVPDNKKKEIMNKKDYSQSMAILHSGFVAQDVEKAAKESGFEFSGVHHPENENDNYSIDYSLLTVPLVKAVQELNAKNVDQQKQIEALKSELEAIKTLLKKE